MQSALFSAPVMSAQHSLLNNSFALNRSMLRLSTGLRINRGAVGVAVSGDVAYVADTTSGLQVIDVSDPSDPALVGSYQGFEVWWLAPGRVSGDRRRRHIWRR